MDLMQNYDHVGHTEIGVKRPNTQGENKKRVVRKRRSSSQPMRESENQQLC